MGRLHLVGTFSAPSNGTRFLIMWVSAASQVSVKRGQCKLSRSLTHPGVTRHFWYHPEQRVILLSTGTQGNDMRAYYLRYVLCIACFFQLVTMSLM